MKVIIYSAAVDGKCGTQSHVFGTEAARTAWLRGIITEAINHTGADEEIVTQILECLNDNQISEAWDMFEDHIRDPLETYTLECTEVEVPEPIPAYAIAHYTRLTATKSRCGRCNCHPTLLCPDEDSLPTSVPSFYICWKCKRINQVAIGEVKDRV